METLEEEKAGFAVPRDEMVSSDEEEDIKEEEKERFTNTFIFTKPLP